MNMLQCESKFTPHISQMLQSNVNKIHSFEVIS